MADFDTAFRRTLTFEDSSTHPGIVTPEPRGARARLGINSNAHPSLPDEFWTGDYKVALEIARKIYRHDYWDALRLDEVVSQDIANKVYDMAVNMGVGMAGRIFQHALAITPDGRVGAITLAASNASDPNAVVKRLRTFSEQHYLDIVASDPGEYGKWRDAWVGRARR